MGNYDEFDLDLRAESGGSEQGEARTSNPTTNICSYVTSIVSGWTFQTVMEEGCSDTCLTDLCPETAYCTGSGNTCTCYC